MMTPSPATTATGGDIGPAEQAVDTPALWRLLSGGRVQAREAISDPNDASEREADRISDGITSNGGDYTGGTDGDACVKSALVGVMQRVHDPDASGVRSDALAISMPLGPGQPLPGSKRSFFERRLGVPLDDVRIHSDQRAGASAQGLGALAYTTGHDVVFAPGRFAPGTINGTKLLAHELVHVIQQRAQGQGVIQRQVTGPMLDPKLPGCKDLLGLIKEAVAELISRAADLVTDPLGLQWDNWSTPKTLPNGTNVGSVAGHQHQYEGWRNRLRNLIAQWDDDDCNTTGLRIPQEARDLVFRPIPIPIAHPRPDTDPMPWEGPGARRVAAAAKGAAIGATVGLVLGGVVGGVLGAGGGTLVAPGVGTIGGGAAGAIAGAEAGLGVGAAAGAAIGGLIGWISEG